MPDATDNDEQLRQLEAEIAAIEAQMLQVEHDKRQQDLDQMHNKRGPRSIRRMSAVQTKHSKRLSLAREHAADESEYDEDEYDDPTGSSYNNYYEDVIEEIIEEEITEEEVLDDEEEIYEEDANDYGYQDHIAASAPVSPPSSNPRGGGLFAELTAKAASKQASSHEVSAVSSTRPAASPASRPPSAAPAGGLFGDMMAAVGQRNQRVETGDLIEQNVKHSAPPPTASKPTGFDLAAMVASAATDRESRLAQGGEKRMKEVEVKDRDEYKMDFKNVAVEAAELGRLTRLNEHIVEAVAVERKTLKDAWESKGLMAIEWRTNHMAIIHEAAALGNQTKMREYVATNFEEEDEDNEYVDEATQLNRMRALAKAEGASKVEHFIALQKMLDAEDDTRGIVRPMYMYNDITKVVLPKGRLPKLDQTKGQEELKKMASPLTEISNDVIKKAIDRMQRMQNEEAEPRMRTVCNCGYCDTASPFQTFAYRVVEGRVKGVHIPKELQHELGMTDGKKYKVSGKGGVTRVTRAIKADATGEIDKEQHFYTKMREKAAREERERIEKAKPRVKRGRVTRDGAPAAAKPLTRGGSSAHPPSGMAPARTSSQGSTASDREQLEAEIAAMEKEIERQQLQAEIKSMEDAIIQQQQQQQQQASSANSLTEPETEAGPTVVHPATKSSATPVSKVIAPAAASASPAVTEKKKGGLMGRMFGRKK